MLNAQEAFKKSQENKAAKLDALREKNKDLESSILELLESSIKKTVESGASVFEVGLEEYTTESIASVIEKLRGSGYKTCLVEQINEDKEVLGHSLRVVFTQ